MDYENLLTQNIKSYGVTFLDISIEDIKKIADRIKEIQSTNENNLTETNTDVCETQNCINCGQCVEKTPDTVRQIISMGAERITHRHRVKTVPEDLAKFIDHTLLKSDATVEDIKKLCTEAKEYQFATVCIYPTFVQVAAKELSGTPVKVCTVVGFPSGAHISEIKAIETRRAIRDGAKEIDMVINIGALKNGDNDLVYNDIKMVVEACEDGSALSKVIIETSLLTDDEKICACELAKRAHANYIKTSTGFGPFGATEHDVALIRQAVQGTNMRIKAAGGIKTLHKAQKLITAGASRIGASAGVKIIKESKRVTISE
jgi:deoxyribose-phosphate aldolase